MRWFDDHCHLADGPEGAGDIAAARAGSVEGMITVGTDLAHSEAAVGIARAHDGVWATAGVHPHEAEPGRADLPRIAELLIEPEVVAVGECGLDYHYEHSPRAVQRDVFAAQIGFAHDHDTTLVIHTREAWDDTFAILDTEGVPSRTVVHCFSGGPAEAERCLARGAHLSFSGIVTFKGAADVRAAVELSPLDRLLIETDSPYLTPVPHRGKRNEPAHVALVGRCVADVLGLEAAAVAEATWANAVRVYDLSL